MKKILLATIVLLNAHWALSQVVFSSNLSSWSGTPLLPTDFMGNKSNIETDSVQQVTTGNQFGMYAARIINEQSTHRRFTTQPMQVDSGATYEIKAWVRGNGDVRFGLFDGRSTGFGYAPYSSYTTINSATNQMINATLICEKDTSNGEFIISIKSTMAPAHIIIDSVVIVKQGTPQTPFVSIYDIQYTTNPNGDSPYNSQIVKTAGIVTAFYSAGYFIQDGNGPWSGLFVYDNTNTVNLGDSVEVTGIITEYFNMTEMTNVSAFNLISSGNPLPVPLVVTTAQANTEPYESVLCKVNNAQCTNPNAGFGLWTVNNGSAGDTLKVDKIIYQYPNPALGSKYNITGVINYAFGEFRIAPRNASDVQLITGIDQVNSYNVNVFPNPAVDYINVMANTKVQVFVYDLNGRLVYENNHNNGIIKINTADWNNGIYILQLNDGNMQKQYRIEVLH